MQYWFVASIALLIIELLSATFGAIFAAVAAAIAGAVAYWNDSLPLQLSIFGVVLIVGLFYFRPRLVARMQVSRGVPARTEQFIGKQAKVIANIDPVAGTGRVLIDGEDWAAQSAVAVKVGSLVIIEGSDGITLKVRSI